MPFAILPVPYYPLVPSRDRPIRLGVAATPGANWLRIYCTDAPLGSALRAELDANLDGRVLLHDGPASGRTDSGLITELAGETTLDAERAVLGVDLIDKPGAYVLLVTEIARNGVGGGGAYEGDPTGYPTETVLATRTPTLYVGQRLETRVGTGADQATLVLYVWDANIQATTRDTHGIVTPALVNPTSARALAACSNADVVAAVAALAGADAGTALGSLATVLDDIVTNFSAHLTQATVHQGNDTNNTVRELATGTKSAVDLIDAITRTRTALWHHMRNDNGGAGLGSGRYHLASGGTVDAPDLKNSLVAGSATDLPSARALLADMHRAYEAHRVQDSDPASHNNADATNVLEALPTLLALDSAFMAAIQSTAPTAPATSHSGVVTLVSGGGFLAVT